MKTNIVHEHAMSHVQQARCGQFFLREPLNDWPSDRCMACIVTPETEYAVEMLMGKVIA